MEYKMKLTVWYIQRFFFNWLSLFYFFMPVMNYLVREDSYYYSSFVDEYFVFITIFYLIMIIRTSHNKPLYMGTTTYGDGSYEVKWNNGTTFHSKR